MVIITIGLFLKTLSAQFSLHNSHYLQISTETARSYNRTWKTKRLNDHEKYHIF